MNGFVRSQSLLKRDTDQRFIVQIDSWLYTNIVQIDSWLYSNIVQIDSWLYTNIVQIDSWLYTNYLVHMLLLTLRTG